VGGAERSVQLLAESLAAAGHEMVVVTLGRERAPRTAEISGVRVYYLPVRNLYWPLVEPRPGVVRKALWHTVDTYNPWMAAAVGEVLNYERPGLVHTDNIAGFSVAVWRAVRSRGLPLVHTLHDQYLLCPRNTMFKNGRDCKSQCVECCLYGFPRKWASGLVDVVTGVSRFILDRHIRYGYFPGVPQAVIYLDSANRVPGASRHGQPATAYAGPLRVGYLGRLHPTKGVDRLVRAFLSLPRGAADLKIAGSGKPEDEATLRALAPDREDISWLGFVPPEALLSALDVLVVPSLWHDTAPRVVFEAFVHGVPVVGSNRGGIPELIADGTGWLFDPDDPVALATVLRRCVEERASLPAMGARAREYARRFSPEAVVAGYVETYKTALRMKRG